MAARKRKQGLNDKQIRILEVLKRFQDKVGYPPSIREIKDKADISSTSVVNYYLVQLEEKGFIERDQHVSRGIRLVKPLSEIMPMENVQQAVKAVRETVEEVLQIPVVGRIFASQPVPVPPSDFSYMDAEAMIDVARSMLPSRERAEGLFALEVRGNSMIDAMVNDGDIVIMKRAEQANNGEMVAVWLTDEDETTLKYFYKEEGQIRLQPANPTMQPIYKDPQFVQVQGKVVMVVRSVGSRPS